MGISWEIADEPELLVPRRPRPTRVKKPVDPAIKQIVRVLETGPDGQVLRLAVPPNGPNDTKKSNNGTRDYEYSSAVKVFENHIRKAVNELPRPFVVNVKDNSNPETCTLIRNRDGSVTVEVRRGKYREVVQ